MIVYPLVFAALVGAVVRYAGDRPTIAFVDLDRLPEELTVGGQTFNVPAVLDQVNETAELVPMEQQEADRKLANGEVNAEIIVPRGFASRLRGMVESPQLLLKTARGGVCDPRRAADPGARLRANQRLQDAYIDANLKYVRLIVEGGTGTFLGNEFDVVGLQRAGEMLTEIEQTTKDPGGRRPGTGALQLRAPGPARSRRLRRVAARDGEPDRARGRHPGGLLLAPFSQLQAYALALTLAFICVLLAAAAIASERDENVIGRLARGLVGLTDLVVVKVAWPCSSPRPRARDRPRLRGPGRGLRRDRRRAVGGCRCSRSASSWRAPRSALSASSSASSRARPGRRCWSRSSSLFPSCSSGCSRREPSKRRA